MKMPKSLRFSPVGVVEVWKQKDEIKSVLKILLILNRFKRYFFRVLQLEKQFINANLAVRSSKKSFHENRKIKKTPCN